MRLLVELSGENADLAGAECLAVADSEGHCQSTPRNDGRVLVLDTQASPEILANRLALAWSVSEHLCSCPIARLEERLAKVDVPSGSFRVRVERLDPSHPSELGKALSRKLGELFSGDRKVDLENPDFELRVLLAGRAHVGIHKRTIDRASFETRRSENRPFNHPISLHPRLARTLVNLTGVRQGQLLLDPFCGTGGVLLEAGLIGAIPIGGDVDARMIGGTRDNLSHFGVSDVQLRQADVGEWPSLICKVDAIATDPPYGRAASTGKEPIQQLYRRAFEAFSRILKDRGRASIVLPDEDYIGLARGHFKFLESYPTRVHRSLTRHFCVFERRAYE
jgi:tRNA (guanine10-N2)-dimethyltransferase